MAKGIMKSSDLENVFAMQLRSYNIIPELEYRFHPTRRWRFDFCLHDEKLAIEVEGGTWSGGRHTRGSGFEADAEKYAEALMLGWRVLRVTGHQVKSGKAIDWTLRLLGKTPRKNFETTEKVE